MKRFHIELAVMRRRLRDARGFGRPLSRGHVRKRSPFNGCSPNQHCGLCNLERSEAKRARRSDRQAARLRIIEELTQ
jgi:hypothetical protein